jgi:acyl dehydratase
MGDDARLRSIEGWLRRPNVVGDVTYISGRVTGKRLDDGVATVTCSLEAKNQHGEETMRGAAEIELLSRMPQIGSAR